MFSLSTDPILALAEPEILRDPYPAYGWLRETQPVFWYAPLDSWILTRHADCVEVMRDNVRFGADWRRIGEELPPHAVSIQTLDPPEHTTVRRLLMDAMRAQDDAATLRMLAERTRDLLGSLAGRASFDFVTEFAEPLALSTVMAYLGVPAPDPSWFIPASNAIADGMDAGLWPERAVAAKDGRIQLADLMDSWLADPPPAGVIGMVARHANAGGVDREVLANTLRVLAHAGYASASKLLGLAADALLSRPGQLGAWAQADPSLAVDEIVRFTSPVQAMARACVQDTEIGSAPVKAGQAVTMMLGAANRDPQRFSSPDTLQLDRRPNPHLGFGRGSHACLGSPLAMAQAKVVLGVLSTDFPAARAVGETSFRPNLTLRGLDRLEVTLQP
ncbi:cytochrome P450 [Nocardioides speluncae]|uniref:cytochrome P450 n=1 Tax=Nocardioides speluncae TaxID=2670337 RepID=UPI00137A2991|nr:cytochrome P450 [Nocardioides speluncae]